MNLSPSKEHDLLHRKLLSLSKQHRRVEAEILDHLQEAEQREDYVPKASVRAVAKNTLRLSLDISTESRQKLDQLRDILSTKKGRDCTQRKTNVSRDT